jgi:hypothetical protein
VAPSDPPTCALSPASVTISGATAGTSTLTLSTTAATSAAFDHPRRNGIPWYAAGSSFLACVLLLVLPARQLSLRRKLGIVVLFVFLAAGLSSCGGGYGNKGGTGDPGTTAGTYSVTVTGTSGSNTETTILTLNVN